MYAVQYSLSRYVENPCMNKYCDITKPRFSEHSLGRLRRGNVRKAKRNIRQHFGQIKKGGNLANERYKKCNYLKNK